VPIQQSQGLAGSNADLQQDSGYSPMLAPERLALSQDFSQIPPFVQHLLKGGDPRVDLARRLPLDPRSDLR
jgi:hypothetical protein